MNTDETFLRAALFEECSKSKILQHIDIESAPLDVIQDLLNKQNSMVVRKIPILCSKYVVKLGLAWLKTKCKQLHFMTPENIVVDVESDELQYLLTSSSSSAPPNLMLVVTKNIVMSVIGSSFSAFTNELVSKSESIRKQSYTKLAVKSSDAPEWSNIKPAEQFTTTFDTQTSSRSPSISRRSSISSNISNKSLSSIRTAKSKIRGYTSPIPNNSNTDDIKKNLLIDAAINQLTNQYPTKISVIEDIQIRPPNQQPSEYENMSDISESDNDDLFDESQDLNDEDQPSDIKLSELSDTVLKSKAPDFYSLVAPDNNNNIVITPKSNTEDKLLVIDVDDSDESYELSTRKIKDIVVDDDYDDI